MTHATIRFQYDTARFELYLDKLTGLPAKGIHQHWVRIYGYWNDTKQKMNFK